MARNKSLVELSDTGTMDNCGSLLMAVAVGCQYEVAIVNSCLYLPSFGSATASEAFFSSLIKSNRPDNLAVTFPSTKADTSSKAVAAESNFWKSFNFNLALSLGCA